MLNKMLLEKGLKMREGSVERVPKGTRLTYRSPAILAEVDLKSSTKIGAYTYFDDGRIGSMHSIGNYCSVAPGCSIGNGNHPIDYLTTNPIAFKSSGEFHFDRRVRDYEGGISRNSQVVSTSPVIGNDVWIGGGVTILRGVRIGSGAVIGANTLVNKDVPDYAVVAGTPMRVIRYRFHDNIIERLKRLCWWDYDILDNSELRYSNIEDVIGQLEELVDSGGLRLLDETRPWQCHIF